VNTAEELNKLYNSHIKLFGPEAWKKLARISMACAALVSSISEDGENLIVKKEHVDWAKDFMIGLYDNELFKLSHYVENQRRQEEADEESIGVLQGLYNNNTIMLKQLEMSTEMNVRDLQMISGLEQKEFNKVIARLAGADFISYGAKIVPTQKFRMAMNRIDRKPYMPRLGER
jgi:hypothetical protein